jgi:cation diffusion facilitator family transporter
MSHGLVRASNIGLCANIILFILKAIVGVLSNSIAVISEAVNSLMDIIASVAIKVGISVSDKGPDSDHHFGHNAAQPIAAFIVAVFTLVVGIEIVKESIYRIIDPQKLEITWIVYSVLIVTIITKIALYIYQKNIGNKFRSPALKAAAIDSLNDVVASFVALLGVISSAFGFYFVDGIAGLIVALFILKSGYDIAKDNIDFLMGRAATPELEKEIKELCLSIPQVSGYNDLRSYYVGDKFHVELHIEVDKNLITQKSHDIGNRVKRTIENLDDIQKAFIHIDPV